MDYHYSRGRYAENKRAENERQTGKSTAKWVHKNTVVFFSFSLMSLFYFVASLSLLYIRYSSIRSCAQPDGVERAQRMIRSEFIGICNLVWSENPN